MYWRIRLLEELKYRVKTVCRKHLISSIVMSVEVGRDSSVTIVTCYELDGPGIKSWWEARFSAPVQNGTETHPASCTIGTWPFLGE